MSAPEVTSPSNSAASPTALDGSFPQEGSAPASAPNPAAKNIAAIFEGAKPVDLEMSSDEENDLADSLEAEIAKAPRKRGRPRKNKDDSDAAPREKRVKQSDSLIGLTEGWKLWHGPDYEPFASFQVGDHWENWPIRSASVSRRLASLSYSELHLAPSRPALEDTFRILEAKAINEGPEFTPWRRFGEEDGVIFVDHCNQNWDCTEITPTGWSILKNHDKKFIRSPRMRPLCEADPCDIGVNEMRRFANVVDDESFTLLVAVIVGAMRPRGPYAIGVINGEQGSGKSGLCRMIRDLIDPSSPAIQGPPKDEQNIITTAQNGHLIVYDNLSSIAAEISDGLCRLSTGSGFAVRALHTDKDENIFEGARPIVVNGIPSLVSRPDLSERSVVIRLATIPEDKRRPEDEIEKDWAEAKPRILGALFDAVSSALRNIGRTSLATYSRMADFEKWLCAAEPGLGWEPGTFSDAYRSNRQDATDATFEADPVAVAIVEFIQTDHPERGWSGTATRLLDLLGANVPESLRRSRSWPQTAQGLGDRLKRIAPLLRGRGLIIEHKHSGVRTITIVPKKGVQ